MLPVGRVANVMIAAGRLTDYVGDLTRLVLDNAQGYVCLANVHMVVTASRNRDLQAVMDKAIYLAPDGMPLVWLLKRQGFAQAQRIPGADLTLRTCEFAAREGIAVGFYGSTGGTIEALKGSLFHKFPQLRIAYCESPPTLSEKPEVDMQVVARLKKSGARIIFVGLGCPKQEFWMAAHSSHLPAVLIGVGAAFDFLAGTLKRAPLWIQSYGMEWFYRLCQEPGRLWKRYLVLNTLFAWMVIKEMVRKKS
jgi:N-acetylglucosaminyldiphosphoundecaprenol N-acetyl-beta-D-mannosaminyltransferase